jgi:hypothetical protein
LKKQFEHTRQRIHLLLGLGPEQRFELVDLFQLGRNQSRNRIGQRRVRRDQLHHVSQPGNPSYPRTLNNLSFTTYLKLNVRKHKLQIIVTVWTKMFQAKRAGDFRVYNGEKQEWDFDSTFRVLCLDEPTIGSLSLNETSQPQDGQK